MRHKKGYSRKALLSDLFDWVTVFIGAGLFPMAMIFYFFFAPMGA